MHSDKVTTTASESRKSTKPIMEKKRRARINASLAELKSLLLEVIKKEGSRHSKMEKADILEMTVKHLRQMQRQHFTAAAASDPTIMNKYRLGFNECAQEVSRYLTAIDGCDVELRARLLNHLANCVAGMGSSNTSPATSMQASSPGSPAAPTAPIPVRPPMQTSASSQGATTLLATRVQTQSVATDVNDNVTTSTQQPLQMTKVFSGLQVIPTKLPSGEIAFVLPANVVGGGQVPNYVIPVYASPNSSSNPLPTAVQAVTPVPSAGTTPAAGLMAIAPNANAFQTCTVASFGGNLNIIPCPVVSPPAPLSSASSTATTESSVLSLSPPVRPQCENRRDDVIDFARFGHLNDVRDQSMWRPW